MKIRLVLPLFSLLIVPLLGLLSFFTWNESFDYNQMDFIAKFLFLVTETAGVYALVSVGIIALIYCFLLKNLKLSMKLIVIVAVSVALMLGIKSAFKPMVKENRPFIAKIIANEKIYDFQKLKGKKKRKIIANYYASHPELNTPQWLVDYRISKTGYSFPSGHSIFVSILVFLAFGFYQLLNRQRSLLYLAYALQIWAILVLISRLFLGVHYPIDEIASIIIAYVYSIILFVVLAKKSKNLISKI